MILIQVENTQAVQFDKDYIGVIYSPYDMHQKGWQSYDAYHMRSSMTMLSLKFKNISMYGMSTSKFGNFKIRLVLIFTQTHVFVVGYTDGWKEGIIDFPHPKMAAELNIMKGRLHLSMAIGIYRKLDWRTKNVGLVEEEIKNAIQAAKLSNRLFPQTVWGISIHMDYHGRPSVEEEILDVADLVDLLKQGLIATNDGILDDNANKGKVSVGIRLWHCSSLLKDGLHTSR